MQGAKKSNSRWHVDAQTQHAQVPGSAARAAACAASVESSCRHVACTTAQHKAGKQRRVSKSSHEKMLQGEERTRFCACAVNSWSFSWISVCSAAISWTPPPQISASDEAAPVRMGLSLPRARQPQRWGRRHRAARRTARPARRTPRGRPRRAPAAPSATTPRRRPPRPPPTPQTAGQRCHRGRRHP